MNVEYLSGFFDYFGEEPAEANAFESGRWDGRKEGWVGCLRWLLKSQVTVGEESPVCFVNLDVLMKEHPLIDNIIVQRLIKEEKNKVL